MKQDQAVGHRVAFSAATCGIAAAAMATGLVLYFLLAWIESSSGLAILPAVFLEEGLKFLVLLSYAAMYGRVMSISRKATGRGTQPLRGAGLPPEAIGLAWGMVAVVMFAAAENMAYFASFPGQGILLRLIWSEPVHLVAALAEAGAVWYFLGYARRPFRPAALASSFGLLAFAIAWHAAFNLIADGPLADWASGQGSGWRSALIGATAANAAALIILMRFFARRIMVGGFLYGRK